MYTLTLCDRDGTLIAVVPDAPHPPRFIHVHKIDDHHGGLDLTDDPDPADFAGNHTVTFARVASAVWVDDDRTALYTRQEGWTL